MELLELQDFELNLEDWLSQGYGVIADEVDGEIRVTVYYASPSGGIDGEHVQEFWPLVPELVTLLARYGVELPRVFV